MSSISKQSVLQAGPGLWTAQIPFADKLPYPLQVNESLLLLVLVAGCQQASGQIMRTLSGKSVRSCCCGLLET